MSPLEDRSPPRARDLQLRERLGAGGSGEVWAAWDPVAGREVAVKRVEASDRDGREQVARELSALRQLRIPGVVRLLDTFVDDGHWCIVMERVQGSPWPGQRPHALPWTWPALQRPAVELVRVLGRVHRLGLLHRDLKPDNVLVDAEGRVTLLDFGLARERGGRTAGKVGGTPAYVAPELWSGRPPGPASDLFSVGVMLYEALTGQLPWMIEQGAASHPLSHGCRAEPLSALCRGLPVEVQALIERLLHADPERRFVDAAELSAALLQGPGAATRGPFPFLGQEHALQLGLDAAREGRNLRIGTGPDLGGGRFLAELGRRLEEEGLSPIVLGPGTTPPPGKLLERARERGQVVLLDETRPRDARSLARVAELGLPVLRLVGPEEEADTRLLPLQPADIQPLFTGLERIFHIPSDAALALWERSAGKPARVAAEARAWVEAGLARWEEGRLRMDRLVLDRMRVGPARPLAPPPPSPLVTGIAPGPARILAWLDLAETPLSAGDLATLLLASRSEVELCVKELLGAGLLEQEGTGLRCQAGAGLSTRLSAEERQQAHARLASWLPTGHPVRLRHLLAAGTPDEVRDESEVQARGLAREGRLAEAMGIIEDVLPLVQVRAGEPPPDLMRLLASFALSSYQPSTLERCSLFLRRLWSTAEGLQTADLLAGYHIVLAGDPYEALARARDLEPMEDPELEDWRVILHFQAALRIDLDFAAEALSRIEGLRKGPVGPQTAARIHTIRGQLLYLQEDFTQAALEHERSIEGDRWLHARLAGLLNASSSWLEAGVLDRARIMTQQGLMLAQAARLVSAEARAEWKLREIAYRSGEMVYPDEELIEGIAGLGVPRTLGLINLGEAAIAWRRGDRATAARLAMEAVRQLELAEAHGPRIIARALALRCGAPAGEGEREVLAAEARTLSFKGMTMQALGLLASDDPRDPLRAEALAQVASWTPEKRALRREIIAADELRGTLP